MIRIIFTCVALTFVVLISAGADQPAKVAAPDASMAELRKARVEAAAEGLAFAKQKYKAALGTHQEVSSWFRRWADARLDAAEGKDQRLAILTESVAEAKGEEHLAKQAFNAGIQTTTNLDVIGAKYSRIEAELRLAKARAE